MENKKKKKKEKKIQPTPRKKKKRNEIKEIRVKSGKSKNNVKRM